MMGVAGWLHWSWQDRYPAQLTIMGFLGLCPTTARPVLVQQTWEVTRVSDWIGLAIDARQGRSSSYWNYCEASDLQNSAV